MAGDDEGGGGDQQQQQRQEPEQPPRQQQQQREGLRALYARVKSAPLEVYAIDTAGVAPIAPPPDNDGTGPSSPSPSSSGYEQVPLRTRASVLDSELRAVLSAPPTLEALHAALERAVLNLRATEAFDDAWAELDGEPQDVPGACTVRLRLRERRWWSARGGAFVGAGGEASVEGCAEARGPLGLADQWRATAEWGQRNSSEFALGWRQPRALPPARAWFGGGGGAAGGAAGGGGGGGQGCHGEEPPGRRLTPEVRLFQTVRNMQHWSSFTESLRGVYVGVSTAAGCPPPPPPPPPRGADGDGGGGGGGGGVTPLLGALVGALLPPADAVHSVGCTLGWMNLSDGSAAAGRSVRAQLGDALRAGLTWQALVDRRGGGARGGGGGGSGGAAAGSEHGYCAGFAGVAGGSAAEDGWALRWSAELGGLAPGIPARGRFAKAGVDWALSKELADLDEAGGDSFASSQAPDSSQSGGGGGEAAAAGAAGAGGQAAAAAPGESGGAAEARPPATIASGSGSGGGSSISPYRLGKLSLSLAASGGVLLPWQPPAVAAPAASAAAGKRGGAAAAAAAAATPGGGAPGARAWWDRPSCIADRFFLGGPDSLRGFDWRGAGPSDERRPMPGAAGAGAAAAGGGGGGGGGAPPRDALGGDLYASVFAALEWLPGAPLAEALNVRLHAFVNGGTCALLSGGGGGGAGGGGPPSLASAVARRAADAASAFRWSAGLGLVVPTPAGRFEANWAWVLASRPGDRARPGLQLGFASSPLLR